MIVAGFLGLAAVNVVMSTAGATTDFWLVRAMMFAIGLAVSYVMLPMQAAAYSQISVTDTGHATAIFTTAQRSASALGIALLSVILVSGAHGQVRAPVGAFHAVYLASAGMALLGALLALTIRDGDARSTMTRQSGENRDPQASATPVEI